MSRLLLGRALAAVALAGMSASEGPVEAVLRRADRTVAHGRVWHRTPVALDDGLFVDQTTDGRLRIARVER
jgi:hypothetical protein